MKKPRAFILVGEKNVQEAQTITVALTQLHDVGFHVLFDGNEVVDYLRGAGKFYDRLTYPFPTWMVLNFQLPVRSALDVMHWVREHSQCGVIPVVLFSDAPKPDEIKQAYALRVNTVFKKPQTLDEMTEAVEMLGSYWDRAEVPEAPAAHKCA